MIVYDASDLVVGRLSSHVAKQLLLGKEIKIINCEKAVLTGSKTTLMSKFGNFKNIGKPFHGPFTPRMPDRILRRSIKRMLPHKLARGRDAYKRVMCYIGTPEELKDQNIQTLDDANLTRLKSSNYTKLGDLSRLIGKYDK